MISLCKVGCVALLLSLFSGYVVLPSHASANLVLGPSALGQQDIKLFDDTLPGRDVPLEKAARQCKGAIVAQLLDMGSADAGPPGASVYVSKWKVIKVFRGKYKGETSFYLTVQ